MIRIVAKEIDKEQGNNEGDNDESHEKELMIDRLIV
jgi:hypothetical protein